LSERLARLLPALNWARGYNGGVLASDPFAYVSNSPLNRVDPLGLAEDCPSPPCGGGTSGGLPVGGGNGGSGQNGQPQDPRSQWPPVDNGAPKAGKPVPHLAPPGSAGRFDGSCRHGRGVAARCDALVGYFGAELVVKNNFVSRACSCMGECIVGFHVDTARGEL